MVPRIGSFVLCLGFVAATLGCGNGDAEGVATSGATTNPSAGAGCAAGQPGLLKLQLVQGANGEALTSIELKDEVEKIIYATLYDNCGQFLRDAHIASWSVANTFDAYLSPLDTFSTKINAHRKSTTPETSPQIRIESEGLKLSLPLNISWTVSTIPDLIRWYRADSVAPLGEGAAIGTPGVSPLPMLGSDPEKFDAVVAESGREPRLRLTDFVRPTLEFCGRSTDCPDTKINSQLQIASSFNTMSATDFTIFFVVARRNNGTNYLLSHQSNSKKAGIFMGFTSGKNFRFTLNGPAGSPSLDVAIPAFEKTPRLEIWTARLDTTVGSNLPGMQLYRDHELVANDAKIKTQQPESSAQPMIGTQSSASGLSKFNLGEFLMYHRALSESELCLVHQFLSQKYQLGLDITCKL